MGQGKFPALLRLGLTSETGDDRFEQNLRGANDLGVVHSFVVRTPLGHCVGTQRTDLENNNSFAGEFTDHKPRTSGEKEKGIERAERQYLERLVVRF